MKVGISSEFLWIFSPHRFVYLIHVNLSITNQFYFIYSKINKIDNISQSEDADCTNEAVLTQANATDWAIHYEEGLRQLGCEEFTSMFHDKVRRRR